MTTMIPNDKEILQAYEYYFPRSQGSWGMYPSSSRSLADAQNDAWDAKNYLLTTSDTLDVLDAERIEALRRFHSTSNPANKQVYQTLAERLERRRNHVEGNYLRVLKGYNCMGPENTYMPGSEGRFIKQMRDRGLPLPPLPIMEDRRSMALMSPSVLAAAHAPIFQEPETPMSLQNFVRLHHDRTRVRLDNIERAYEQQSKVRRDHRDLEEYTKALYDTHIAIERNRLKSDRAKQRDALLNKTKTELTSPEERKRTEEIIRGNLSVVGINYEYAHGLLTPINANRAVRDRTPPHAPKLRTSEEELFPDGHGYAVYQNINDAMQKSLDEIDLLTKELNDAQENQKKMTKSVAKSLYGRSIVRLEDRIEVIRRHLDKLAYGHMDPIPRNPYIPGSENHWLRNAFRNNDLDWDQEHAHIG